MREDQNVLLLTAVCLLLTVFSYLRSGETDPTPEFSSGDTEELQLLSSDRGRRLAGCELPGPAWQCRAALRRPARPSSRQDKSRPGQSCKQCRRAAPFQARKHNACPTTHSRPCP